jgi:hypothetical protein
MAGILNQFMPSLNNIGMNAGNMSQTTPQTTSASPFTASPTQTPLPNGVKANNPNTNVTPPSNTIKSTYQAPANALSQSSIQSASQSNPSSFNFLPGETPQAYNSRIAALVAGQGSGQTGNGTSGTSNLTFPTSQTSTQPQTQTSGTQANGSTTPPPTPTNAGFLGQLMSNTGNSQYNTDNTNLQNLKNQQTYLENNIAGGDQPLYFKQGEMGQEQQGYQTRLAAAGQAVANDISEQGAQTTAATAGATATLPGNQNVQVPYSNQYLNGTTGQPVNPQASQAMQSAVALEASKVANNLESLSTAQGNLSSYGQGGLDALNKALGPNFNANTNAGASAAQQSNTSTAGTASTNSYQTIYSNANTQVAQISQQRSAINAVGSQALSMMANDPAINHFATQFGNQKLNQLATQLSSPQYAAFNTAIQSLQARIGAALQAGEIPTAATGNAQSIANGDLTLNALSSTLQQVDAEMGAFQDTNQQLADYAKGQMSSGSSGGASGNSYVSPSGNTYTLPY